MTEKLKILLVEDNGVFHGMVAEILAQHDVRGVKTLADGIEQFYKIHPDIVFLDIALPDGNGIEMLSKIKTTTPNAYVIMMTASRVREDILQSMEEGAQGYIIKPFSSEIMLECIKEYYNWLDGK